LLHLRQWRLSVTRKVIVTCVAVAALATASASGFAVARDAHSSSNEATATALVPLSKTIAGEPLAYPNTPQPVVSSTIATIPPGGVTEWMTHPVPAYLYMLEGTLTVELVDGRRYAFDAGQSFLQCRTTWHRGRNEGTTPVRFLAVFVGAQGVPEVVHPPSGPLVGK
jgi:quercetin dioxygenase-like cupin family protein